MKESEKNFIFNWVTRLLNNCPYPIGQGIQPLIYHCILEWEKDKKKSQRIKK